MALEPQNDIINTNAGNADYPLGSAKNVSSAGAQDGTPYEAQLLNDIWGFLQSILTNGGVVPNNIPDNVNNQQYVEALINFMASRSALGNSNDLDMGAYAAPGSNILTPATSAKVNLQEAANFLYNQFLSLGNPNPTDMGTFPNILPDNQSVRQLFEFLDTLLNNTANQGNAGSFYHGHVSWNPGVAAYIFDPIYPPAGPVGWTLSRPLAGICRITHNLGTVNYTVQALSANATLDYVFGIQDLGTNVVPPGPGVIGADKYNFIDVYVNTLNGQSADADFHFMLSVQN